MILFSVPLAGWPRLWILQPDFIRAWLCWPQDKIKGCKSINWVEKHALEEAIAQHSVASYSTLIYRKIMNTFNSCHLMPFLLAYISSRICVPPEYWSHFPLYPLLLFVGIPVRRSGKVCYGLFFSYLSRSKMWQGRIALSKPINRSAFPDLAHINSILKKNVLPNFRLIPDARVSRRQHVHHAN